MNHVRRVASPSGERTPGAELITLKNLFTDPGIRDPPQCRACRAPSALLRHVLRSLLCLPVCAPRARKRNLRTEPNGGLTGGDAGRRETAVL